MRKILIALVRGYQWILSPVLQAAAGPGSGCRFSPSCSEYAAQAIAEHGSVRGTALAARRLCRCHPFTPGGWDPVPRCTRVS